MAQQDEWQAHPINASRLGRQHAPNMEADDSPTFVKARDEGVPRTYPTHVYAPETAIPPPPPGIDLPPVISSKSLSGYRIALAVLLVLVVALGSLEMIQVAAHLSLFSYSSGSASSNQAGITSAQSATSPQQPSPDARVTPATIKENVMLTCGTCNDPVLTTLRSITIDTTNYRVIMTVALHNISGAQQIDYFAEFSLQDQFGTTYQGTGELNSDYFLDAGQTAMKTEIFSFLPRPGVPYTLVALLGIAGITYDPLQVTF